MSLLIEKGISLLLKLCLLLEKMYFYSLCKSIIGQQISVTAANSVFLKI